MIVVDIQGVGDLYTDPQIHTSGNDIGSGSVLFWFSLNQRSAAQYVV